LRKYLPTRRDYSPAHVSASAVENLTAKGIIKASDQGGLKMSNRLWLVLGITLATALGIIGTAHAADPRDYTDRKQYYRDLVTEQAETLDAARQALQAKPVRDWTDAEVDGYLTQAFWAVYYGLQSYLEENQCLPASTAGLAETEYIPHWPGNPLLDWQPMRVLTVDEGFTAGELVLQICPPEYYSGLIHPHPESFELGVYGRSQDVDLPARDDPSIGGPWVVVPAGVLIQGGMFTESSSSTRKKWARMKQRQKDEDIQN
jgi:hypothetical protein